MPLTAREQGGGAAAGAEDWHKIATWLKVLPGTVLICVENAEEALRGSTAQVCLRVSQLRRPSHNVDHAERTPAASICLLPNILMPIKCTCDALNLSTA